MIPGTIILIRPGALGDTLVALPALRFLKDAFTPSRLTLIAPGQKGRFFLRPDWADQTRDWDSALFASLHAEHPEHFPEALRGVFQDATLVVSLAGSGQSDKDAVYTANLKRLAPAATLFTGPALPPDATTPIAQSLLLAVSRFCHENGLATQAVTGRFMKQCLNARITIPRHIGPHVPHPYAVIHPGSGSFRKNWPLENFAAVGRALADNNLFPRIVVTSGEADGDLGKRLAAAIPGADLMDSLSLDELAGVLSRASLYLGNDSGVSHLASSVQSCTPGHPIVLTVFGPSNSAIWQPRHARVLEAGADMDRLTPDAVLTAVHDSLKKECQNYKNVALRRKLDV